MDKEKYVDEGWKESAEKEKEILDSQGRPLKSTQEPSAQTQEEAASEPADTSEINFLNYITSLAMQTLIFLGEVPNPITNIVEKNLAQAKFLIDTLLMLREKTKGNLSKQESDMINAALYELQVKFVEITQKEPIP